MPFSNHILSTQSQKTRMRKSVLFLELTNMLRAFCSTAHISLLLDKQVNINRVSNAYHIKAIG